MRKRLLISSAIAIAATITAALPSRGYAAAQKSASNQACKRGCLDGFMDEYLSAMVDHNVSKVAVSPDFRFTENSAPLRIGDGLWQTITGLGTYKLVFVDPQEGEVGAFVTIEENHVPAALFLRLKIANQAISEAETIVVRKIDQPFLAVDQMIKPAPIFLEAVPADQRSSRKELQSIVNKYFDGIEQSNGDIVPFAKGVVRIENGIQTCPSQASSRLGALDCGPQLDTGIFKYIFSIRPRRFVVIDEERGLAVGIFRFNHPGNILSVDVPGKGPYDMGAGRRRPYSALIAEMFKIQNHQIQQIVALFGTEAYKMPTGWDDEKLPVSFRK